MREFFSVGHPIGKVATRINTERRTRNYVTQLMAMGYRVTLEPAA